MLNVPSLENLVHQLNRLPGVGPKTALRLAYYILRSRDNYSEQLRQALVQVEDKVGICASCYCYSETKICDYCSHPNRSDDVICVVEEPLDILRIENSGVFRGRYHVLQGSISPLDGVSASDLRIKELIDKITAREDSEKPVEEIILALDADLEGDTTALYLKQELKDKGIKLTRIAHGIPFGSDIDYIDHRTLGVALDNRVEL